MNSTPETMTDLEERLRAALSARAELVRPEDLSQLATVAPLRPRWRSSWVLLATAAVVLLVLGVVFQGAGGRQRSEDLAPQPDDLRVVLPDDVGRDWKADDLSTPARLDLDGDGTEEKVEFLGEPTPGHDGRIRLQTRLSSTGEESFGIAELGSTIGTSPLEPIDADHDGDQELVLLHELDMRVVGGLYAPVVFDLRDGLLVQAVPEDPDLLLRGNVTVPGAGTPYYEKVRSHDFWIDEGTLFSSRSVDAFVSANMTLLRSESYLVDAYEWTLDGEGILRAGDAACLVRVPEGQAPCGSGAEEGYVPYIDSVATETFGIGESADFREGYRFSASIEAVADPSLVVRGDDGRTINHGLEVADPRVSTVQPTSVFYDGASFVVTSGADPAYVAVLVQRGDELRSLRAVGEVELTNEGDTRTWLTRNGSLVSVTAQDDGSWTAWTWQMVSREDTMAALPWGRVCFDDVDDPSTARAC